MLTAYPPQGYDYYGGAAYPGYEADYYGSYGYAGYGKDYDISLNSKVQLIIIKIRD